MDHLRRQGRKPLYVWTRGGYTPLFEGLKALLRWLPGRAVPPPGNNPQRAQAFSKGWVRRLWLVLALLDLLWVYGLQLRWWRWRGRSVVCDYPSSLLDEPWRTLYGINPMAGVVEGFRWALLGTETAPGPIIIVSALVSVGLLISGAYYFRRMEKTFADVV
jgi:hypothetical protein